MGRALKPYVVDKLQTKHGWVDILFDRDRKNFFAKVGDEELRADTINEVKEKAQAELEKVIRYVWEPVITVGSDLSKWEKPDAFEPLDREKMNDVEVHVKLSFERLERALVRGNDTAGITKVNRRYDGSNKRQDRWFTRSHSKDFEQSLKGWEKDAEEMRRLRAVGDGAREYHGDWNDVAVIPYSDEAWEGLCRVADVLRNARSSIRHIVRGGGAQVMHLITKTLERPIGIIPMLLPPPVATKSRKQR